MTTPWRVRIAPRHHEKVAPATHRREGVTLATTHRADRRPSEPTVRSQARAMRRGQDVRKQLVTIMDRYKMDIVAAGKNYNKVHRRARSRS